MQKTFLGGSIFDADSGSVFDAYLQLSGHEGHKKGELVAELGCVLQRKGRSELIR